MKFVDLGRQLEEYKSEIMAEIEEVLSTTAFINGPAVKDLEAQLAEYVGVSHAVGCSSGTDALILGLMALGVGRGDEVIVPDFTFIATAETVSLMGATPVFADVRPDTYNLDPDAIEALISERTVGIMPVSLYGQVADLHEINAIAERHGLWVMEDGAQSFGATYHGKQSCSLSTLATTSFFPAKPLGAYGDAGAVFTNDDALAAKMRMLLNHGQRSRYNHAIIGLNARLDTLQAAILKVKLRHFPEEIAARQRVADAYTEKLATAAHKPAGPAKGTPQATTGSSEATGQAQGVVTPTVLPHNTSTWAQYTIRVADRDRVRASLQEKGIPTSVHYPTPLHTQDAFAGLRSEENPEAAKAAAEVLSLPMHPFLTADEITTVADAVTAAVESSTSPARV